MRQIWVVIPLVLIGIVGISESFAEENSSIIYENDLEFSVMTDKKHYHDDEIIHIFWHVKNIGNTNISYTTSNTCNDGFSWSITNSEIHRVNGVLGESANLIKEDDSTVLKFENPGFYGDILQSIKDEPNKTRDILIFTSNGEKLVDILKEKFEVVKHSEPKSEPDAIGARVSVKYIPEIANMELVTNILEGDTQVCGSAELTKILEPNEIIDGNFSWSQLVHVKDNPPQHVPDGYYSILVRFNQLSNCVMIGINVDNTQPEKIPCFEGIPSNVTKSQYVEHIKKQISIIEHPELRTELIKELDLLTADSYHVFVQPKISPLSSIDESKHILSPKQQVNMGIIQDEIKCKNGLELIFKSKDNSPACVKPQTAEKLMERGWGVGPDNNKFQNLFEAKVTQIINGSTITKSYYFATQEEADYFEQIGKGNKSKLRPEGYIPYKTPKISPELQEVLDSEVERVDVRIVLKNTPKPPPDFLKMTDEEQVANLQERYAQIRMMQQDLVDYITNNDGVVIKQLEFINSVYADVPVTIIDELKNRDDISTINYYDKDAIVVSMPIHPPG